MRPLDEKRAAARDLPGRPHSARLTRHPSPTAWLGVQASAQADADFLVFHDADGARHHWSYGAFAARVERTAAWLHGHGIRAGDRLATVSPNHADTVFHYFAAWRLGAVVVPLNVGEDDARLAYILEHSQARLAFVRDAHVERIRRLCADRPDGPSGLEQIVVTGDPVAGLPHFPSLLREPAPDGFDPADPDPDADALIVYTSGTTGKPKGVVLSQYNLAVDAEQIAAWHGLARGDRMMCVLPIHHVNGTVVTLLTPLVCGGCAVLTHKFQTPVFFERLAAERIAVVSVVPTLLAFLLQARDDGREKAARPALPHFRHVICGAGPLTVELARRFEEVFDLRVVHGYGLSETTCYSCFLPRDLPDGEHRAWLGAYGLPSIGVALPSNEMDIHDPDGRALGPGRRGEIVIRGHNVMRGYFANEAADAEAFAHGWFRSGDEGFYELAADGRRYYFIAGRLKELIIRGGVNIAPLEIDEVLMNLPGVRAGIAVGFEHDVYGEEVGAYVVPADGVELEETAVLAACRAKLPASKCPKVVVFGRDIPVTSTGKYRRNELKPLFAAWRAL